MDHRLIEGLMEAIAPLIKSYVDDRMEKDIAPLLAKIAVLEDRPVERGEQGLPGKDIDPAEVQKMVDLAVSQIPPPKDGESITVDDVRPLLKDMVTEAVAAIELPVPKDGAPGKDAEVDLDALALKAAELIEKPKDGAPGKDAEVDLDALAIKAAELIERPKDGERGPEGVGVKDLLTDADGNLVATLTNGEVKRVGRVVGRDGKDGEAGEPGKDGTDGLGFDDMSADLSEDGRTVEFRFMRGEQTKVFPIKFQVPLEAGIWRDGHDYEKGDGVTFGGSFWFAQKDSPQGRPDSGNKDWRLGVKKGRDGKDGSAPPPQPVPVHVPGAKSG